MQAEASSLSLVSLQGVRRESLVTSQSIYRPTPLPSHAILPTHTFVRTDEKGPVSCTRSNPPLVLFVCGLFLLLQNCLGCLLLLRCHMERSSMSNGGKVGAGWWKKNCFQIKKTRVKMLELIHIVRGQCKTVNKPTTTSTPVFCHLWNQQK